MSFRYMFDLIQHYDVNRPLIYKFCTTQRACILYKSAPFFIEFIVEVTHALFTVVKGLFYHGKLLYRVWPTLPGEFAAVYFHRNIKMNKRIYRDKYRAGEQDF